MNTHTHAPQGSTGAPVHGSQASKVPMIHQHNAIDALGSLTITAATLIGFTTVVPTKVERMKAITAAQERIAKASDRGEIERDAAIVVANLAAIIG